MPGHQVHCFVDKELFGKSYRKLHRLIDAPYLILGQTHRALFHDIPTAMAIAEDFFPFDEKAQASAFIHVQLDNLCSSNPDFHRTLEVLAQQDSRKRKRAKKKKPKNKKKEKSAVATELKKLAKSCNGRLADC